MISFEEAHKIVLNQSRDYGSESVPMINAMGRVLAEDIYADRDFPPFNRATKNGIAINFDAIEHGRRSFEIKDILAAGKPTVPFLETEECIEIMSGAVVPFEADTVVMYEDLSIVKDIVTVNSIPVRGQNICLRGSNQLKGARLLKKNTKLTASEMGILASVGKKNVWLKKTPRVAVIATGNELVKIDEQPLQHQIRRSNNYSLFGALELLGIKPMLLYLEDDKDLIRQKLAYAIEAMDVLLISGGISIGKFDFIPKVLEELGVEKLFDWVNQYPAKPFWFGTHNNADTVVFSFPGNPVSIFLNFHIYFRDWLYKSIELPLNEINVLLEDAIVVAEELTQFVGVEIILENGCVLAKTVATNGLGDLVSLSKIHGFIRLSSNKKLFQKGEPVPFIPTKNIY
ncbi:MAG: molybdopterin molybdotransferase MoeA [Eudoraea sp.]|uniref:molybdopterin molybdotransferase MoeA n=1 Tax=Eudoraea sp. TaxID=1979955 RepID=UPI003264C68B